MRLGPDQVGRADYVESGGDSMKSCEGRGEERRGEGKNGEGKRLSYIRDA